MLLKIVYTDFTEIKNLIVSLQASIRKVIHGTNPLPVKTDRLGDPQR